MRAMGVCLVQVTFALSMYKTTCFILHAGLISCGQVFLPLLMESAAVSTSGLGSRSGNEVKSSLWAAGDVAHITHRVHFYLRCAR